MGEIISKRIPELCIIECLYVSLARKDPERTLKIWKQSDRFLNINKL
jgi:DNA-binding MurR/RpiR family transcriptional regulator